MLKFAHIINPVNVGDQSDLYIAQPITFETMRRAQETAHGIVEVELFTTQYPEDHVILPEGFNILPDLERSVIDIDTFQIPRKLPLLKDILDRLYAATDADYLIYTNVDIALMPAFYITVARMLEQYDALVINRRNIPDHYTSVDDLLLMYAEIGDRTAGFDCFVFRREIYPHFILNDIAIGIARVGFPMYANMLVFAKSFMEYRDVHLTFHIGQDKVWQSDKYNDYDQHNQRELRKTLVALREFVGTADATTNLGQFLLDVYQRRNTLDFMDDFLKQDTDPLPPKLNVKIKPHLFQRLKRAIRLIVAP